MKFYLWQFTCSKVQIAWRKRREYKKSGFFTSNEKFLLVLRSHCRNYQIGRDIFFLNSQEKTLPSSKPCVGFTSIERKHLNLYGDIVFCMRKLVKKQRRRARIARKLSRDFRCTEKMKLIKELSDGEKARWVCFMNFMYDEIYFVC